MDLPRRVVITGIGPITPIGSGVAGMWRGVLREKTAVDLVTRFDTSVMKSKIAAEVRDFEPSDYIDAKRLKRLDRFAQFSLAAARMAMDDSGLALDSEDRDRIGVCVGTALGGVAFAESQYAMYYREGLHAVQPSLAFSVFGGASSCNIAIEHNLSGPNTANTDSCASGAIAIANAKRYIAQGDADMMLAGGVEAPLAPLCFGAFTLIRAMSTRNEEPEKACCPFDAARDGFVMGEGATLLVLEEREHALRRGARIYAELLGTSMTNDAYHMTAPHPEGRHAARVMQLALEDAKVSPSEIDYICAHGSSTPLNDKVETLAIKTVFGERAYSIPVSSTKAMHAHALGATGAIEAGICALAIHRGWIPPTVNLEQPDPECDLDYVPNTGREANLNRILSNSFGFGGINAALVFGKEI